MKAIKVKVKCPYCGESRNLPMGAEHGMVSCCRCTKCNKWMLIHNVYGQPEVTKG